jgi:hypothetical protein
LIPVINPAVSDVVHQFADEVNAPAARLAAVERFRWIGRFVLQGIEGRAVVRDGDEEILVVGVAGDFDLVITTLKCVAVLDDVGDRLVYCHLAMVDCPFIQHGRLSFLNHEVAGMTHFF